MRISRVRVENFRSIKDLELELDEATVFLGPNNAGKTAVLDAVRIVLSRRWGQRGTGFTENDVHRPDPDGDPRSLPPIKITLIMEEEEAGRWDPDMVAALDDIIGLASDGRRGAHRPQHPAHPPGGVRDSRGGRPLGRLLHDGKPDPGHRR